LAHYLHKIKGGALLINEPTFVEVCAQLEHELQLGAPDISRKLQLLLEQKNKLIESIGITVAESG
jgi:HPt (histidine-containing phosphotransfer) domain-containing protein